MDIAFLSKILFSLNYTRLEKTFVHFHQNYVNWTEYWIQQRESLTTTKIQGDIKSKILKDTYSGSLKNRQNSDIVLHLVVSINSCSTCSKHSNRAGDCWYHKGFVCTLSGNTSTQDISTILQCWSVQSRSQWRHFAKQMRKNKQLLIKSHTKCKNLFLDAETKNFSIII